MLLPTSYFKREMHFSYSSELTFFEFSRHQNPMNFFSSFECLRHENVSKISRIILYLVNRADVLDKLIPFLRRNIIDKSKLLHERKELNDGNMASLKKMNLSLFLLRRIFFSLASFHLICASNRMFFERK